MTKKEIEEEVDKLEKKIDDICKELAKEYTWMLHQELNCTVEKINEYYEVLENWDKEVYE